MYSKSTWKLKYIWNVLKYKYKYWRFPRNVLEYIPSTLKLYLVQMYLSRKYSCPALATIIPVRAMSDWELIMWTALSGQMDKYYVGVLHWTRRFAKVNVKKSTIFTVSY